MKKMIGIFALVIATVACQHQAPPKQAAAKETATTVAPVQLAAMKPAALVPSDTLTPAMLALLQRCDFSSLLQTVHGTDSIAGSHAQNGFFGPDHYRIEVVLTKVWRDSLEPTLYRLQGKNRYKGIITPFAGTLTITHLMDQAPYPTKLITQIRKNGGELNNEPNMYSAEGDFELKEDVAQRGTGVFQGKVAIDWHLEDDGSVVQQIRTNESASQGGGVKYEGIWTNSTTHRTYPVVWVDDIFQYTSEHHVLNNFLVGERDPDFNPKYAKLGWNSYWENDEWWADSPKPKLNL